MIALGVVFGLFVGIVIGLLLAGPSDPPRGGYQPRPSGRGSHTPPFRNPPPRQP